MNEEHKDGLEIPPVGEFLSQNYALFAVDGILAALAVYLRDFRGATNPEMVNLGIVSSLLMFVVCSAVIMEKMVDLVVNSDNVGFNRLAPYSVLIIGVGGLTVSILSITFEFRTQLIQIVDWGIGIAIYIAYMNWYPANAHHEIEGIKDETRESLDRVDGHAATLTVLCVLFFFSNFSDLYSSVIDIASYQKLIISPSFLGIVILQFLLSIVLEIVVLLRNEGVDWITN